ncbi:olfactory receptor 11H6-like [Pelodiscus sinensis]|uniref:olfactory receptor 11H6-like n=1 Tax=Pelodiscus sinensis TaxID=13735 RepID=UPI003F6D0332
MLGQAWGVGQGPWGAAREEIPWAVGAVWRVGVSPSPACRTQSRPGCSDTPGTRSQAPVAGQISPRAPRPAPAQQSRERPRSQLRASPMNPANGTTPVTHFILLGFPSLSGQSRNLLCAAFSSVYAGTLAGNLCIVWAVARDPRLQRLPMYILLGNFSWLETCYVTTTMPRLLSDLLHPGLPISFHACIVQFYIFFCMGTTECCFLAAMGLDRYLAICQPLRYPVLMSPRRCWVLAASCWLTGFLWFVLPVVLISQLSFCVLTLDHFVCDPGPLLAASCAPAPQAELSCYVLSSLIIFGAALFTLASYGLIVRAVLRLPAGAGRHKAFSTCSSHLAVITLFWGSGMVTYITPSAAGGSGKMATLFYAVATPLLNPLIYSLRNKEMKEALRRTLLGKV